MRVFDQIDPRAIDRREQHLWLLALSVIIILSAGTALLMYPAVFSDPLVVSGSTLRTTFFSFCGLAVLLLGYFLDRQIVIHNLRKALSEEQIRMVSLRQKASADLLGILPGFSHFQNRLAMEFRRAVTARQYLSLLLVGLTSPRKVTDQGEIGVAYGDAAKALLRKLRVEDSIYLFAPGVFGIVLPGVSGDGASRVAERLTEGLADASGASDRFKSDVRVITYPEHVSSAPEMEQMARTLIPK
jgi:GGDEF domain-containing protein